MNRRFGNQPEPGRRYTPRPGAYAIIALGDGVLATWQAEPWPEFQLPGGGIDPGEAVLPALHREVMEETGYRIAVDRRLGMFHRYTYMPEYDLWAQKLCHIYLARAGQRIGPPSEAGHLAMPLPWAEAEARVAVSGDRYFLGVARRLLGV